MAGIYIHIPFCKKRCIYCDFYSTTQGNQKGEYIKSLCKELYIRKDYLQNEPIHTIYIGGGTPSQLTLAELQEIFHTIFHHFTIGENAEITMEANPDDLTEDYLTALRTLPINRISMGVQTFNDRKLELLNRRHTAKQAYDAVQRCNEAGFQNISIDLIYGLPN
jgi:oxygen-independent coproporphyrinogen-3 oxidase